MVENCNNSVAVPVKSLSHNASLGFDPPTSTVSRVRSEALLIYETNRLEPILTGWMTIVRRCSKDLRVPIT